MLGRLTDDNMSVSSHVVTPVTKSPRNASCLWLSTNSLYSNNTNHWQQQSTATTTLHKMSGHYKFKYELQN